MTTHIKAFLGDVDAGEIVFECTTDDIELNDEEVNVINKVCMNIGENTWDFIEWTVDDSGTSIYRN